MKDTDFEVDMERGAKEMEFNAVFEDIGRDLAVLCGRYLGQAANKIILAKYETNRSDVGREK